MRLRQCYLLCVPADFPPKVPRQSGLAAHGSCHLPSRGCFLLITFTDVHMPLLARPSPPLLANLCLCVLLTLYLLTVTTEPEPACTCFSLRWLRCNIQDAVRAQSPRAQSPFLLLALLSQADSSLVETRWQPVASGSPFTNLATLMESASLLH